MIRTIQGTLALLAIATAGSARAQDNPPAPQAVPSAPRIEQPTRPMPVIPVSSDDRKWLEHIAQGNAAEIAFAQLALQKSGDPNVRASAQHIIDDHQKLGQKASQTAARLGLMLPNTMSDDDKATLKELQDKSGKDFDRAFTKALVKDHERDVRDTQKVAQNAQNPDVKDLATSALPVFEQHLQMVRQNEKQLGM